VEPTTHEVGPPVLTGAVAPEALIVNITPQMIGAPLDLTTVTGAQFHIKDPNGGDRYWPGTLSNQTTTTLTVTYLLQAPDIDMEGRWRVVTNLSVPPGPNGVRRVEPFYFRSEAG
jgi:hypothetical protein